MKEIRHLKTIKNKRNLNTKWLLLQNDQNADTTLLHSHDDFDYGKHKIQIFNFWPFHRLCRRSEDQLQIFFKGHIFSDICLVGVKWNMF